MHRLIATCLALSLLLAGCASDTSTTDPCTDDPMSCAPVDDVVVQQNATNTPPVASLTADRLNGTAPMVVNFTLDASDADGNALNWTLVPAIDGAPLNFTLSGNGTALPQTVNVTFDRAGNASVAFIVSDGINQTLATLDLMVLEGVMDADPCAGQENPCMVAEDLWAEFWSDGTCHAKGAVGSEEIGWVHDRPGPELPVVGGPPVGETWTGTGYVSGGGTWFYEESNGVPGLQLGGISSPVPVLGGGESDAYVDCANPDTLIF